ncbi:type III-B CRISPR module RAMP protein Cmr1 [Anoxybacillus sp. UARK-01]|uniref:type III-B CRISPR module RAMP protein Cmr1 n=1 Tax=Anoxybacillus sp. UARK-01 TaxID=1895648 RepID=UPI0009BC3F91|nr:type III-B CRISPR module RAMP protein Cmr1 [Anoxybacillus sp. UARK-01]OQM46678.1 type III-B CRISPR module RAMP protein Cmr1 [Anoxybacillus sp. UARK-01]
MIEKEPFISIKLQTRTPLWTGNADRNTGDIKTSNIWGNIRWWYENISRMYAKKVCDPTVKEKCQLNHKNFWIDLIAGKTADEALDNQEICPACKLFGCAGWSGKLKLVVEEKGGRKIQDIRVPSRTKKNKEEKPLMRSLSGKMFAGEDRLVLHFYKRKEISLQEKDMLRLTIRMISDYAAIGGRTSQGNGVVQVMTEDDGNLAFENPQYLKENLSNSTKSFFFIKFNLIFNESIATIIKQEGFWGLKNSGKIAKLAWENNWRKYGFIPIGFHIRDTTRRMERDKNLRHKLFGERGEGSKILVSHGYKVNEKTVQVRIWGYGDNELFVRIEEVIKKYLNLNKNLFSETYNRYNEVKIANYTKLTDNDIINQYIAGRS